MKNNKQILISILLIAVICFSLFSCVAENNVSQNESQLETSSNVKQSVELILGDFEPEEEQIVTYEKALERYKDSYTASFYSSRSRESYLLPKPGMDIEKVRISIPKRGILLPDTSGSGFEDDSEIYQIYYGYYSNGLWHDYPAENYELKTLHDPIDSGFSDGWEAMCGSHVVKIGPYVLVVIFDVSENATVEDDLGSNVMVVSADAITDNTPYLIFEDNFSKSQGHITMEYLHGFFLVLEYDKLSTSYSLTIKEYEPILDAYSETVYTYDDIMEALNRK